MASAFDNLAPRVMRGLIADFGLTVEQAAGIVGNLGAESGLRAVNEIRPTVPGSLGGFGWAQWTGPRRVSFETYARARGLDPTSYEANYGYLRGELAGSITGFDFRHTIDQVKKTTTVMAAAQTFEANYEKAGIVNMAARVSLGGRAMSLYMNSNISDQPGKVATMPSSVTLPDQTAKPWYQSKAVIGGILSIALPLLSFAFPALKLVNVDSATGIVLQVLQVVGPVLGGALAIFGRVTATQPISGTKQAPVPNQSDAVAGIMGLPLNTILQELPVVLEALGQLGRATSTTPPATGSNTGGGNPTQLASVG